MIATALHRLVVCVAVVPLLAAFALFGAFTLLALMAHAILPAARWGNCWTYAVPRFALRGGYLTWRGVHGVTFFGLPLLHAMWQPRLDEVRMTYPRNRRKGWLPWFALAFRYDVWHGDPKHAPAAGPWTEPPDNWRETAPPTL